MRLKVLLVCAALGLGLGLWGLAGGGAKTLQAKEADVTCSEANEKLIRFALTGIFGDRLPAEAVENFVCAKSAYVSDLFVLGQIAEGTDLGALSFAPADEWQATRLEAAWRNFPDQMPPEGTAHTVTSAFAKGGAQTGVIVDFGAAGSFVYLEL